MFGVAVQVTDEPGQKGLGTAVMDTPAGTPRVPVIVTVLLVAGLLDVQSSEELRVQVTISPEAGL